MLVSREELKFDFGDARFDTESARDRELLAWVFSQFLYGEVTGIQCGHWLYRAPHLGAATFLAKQASEELSHVRKFLRIFSLLDATPERAHPAVRFLSTGLGMGVPGGSWGEHVTLEMALGEGLVLGVFYALADTIADPEIRRILETAAAEEERHVEFGEREAQAWLASNPGTRPLLLGLALVQLWALRAIRSFVVRRLKTRAPGHPVLSRFDGFYDHSLRCFELRIERLSLADRPIRSLGRLKSLGLVGALPLRKVSGAIFSRKPLLTSTYLEDPALKDELSRFRRS